MPVRGLTVPLHVRTRGEAEGEARALADATLSSEPAAQIS